MKYKVYNGRDLYRDLFGDAVPEFYDTLKEAELAKEKIADLIFEQCKQELIDAVLEDFLSEIREAVVLEEIN